jgi:raffinose/stachyose/melibiose transport system permease protein
VKKKEITNYLFILPIFILFFIFIVYPIIYNISISFYDWNGISIEKEFIGIDNYKTVFADPILTKILKNFIIFAFSTIVIQSIFGMLFASFFINQIKLSAFYRILFYLPVVVTPSIVGQVFSKFFETNRGYLNTVLRSINLDFLCHEWLASPKTALGCIIFINIWQWTGYSMLLYYADMLNISSDIYEAAKIDGANKVKQFTKITFPLLRGTHYTLFILGMLGSLKCYDLVYILTDGGPSYATETFSTYIQRLSFDMFKQGQSSTTIVIMFSIAMIITIFQLKLYYSKDKEAAS